MQRVRLKEISVSEAVFEDSCACYRHVNVHSDNAGILMFNRYVYHLNTAHMLSVVFKYLVIN